MAPDLVPDPSLRRSPVSDPATALDRARAGDEDAFRSLVDPHLRELRVHCYRILGSVQDAEDLLQETLLAAWRGLGQYREQASLRVWLCRIATNRCLNALRARGRRPQEHSAMAEPPAPTRLGEPSWLEPYPDVLLDGLEDSAPGPEARYEATESIALAFVASLQHLPPHQRCVLVLRDVLGFRAAEVAGMFDTTEAAVKGALQRARDTLQARLPTDDVEAWRPGTSPGASGCPGGWWGTSVGALAGRGRGPLIRMIATMTDMFRLLEAEWTMHLAHDPSARARLGDVLAVAGAGSLGELEAYVRTAAPPEADAVLLALVRRAVVGDDLAARVLLQLLLPGAKSLARRWWALGDHHERAAATVLAVYHRIRNYPVERRPGRVAANILLDAATELRRGVPRLAEVPTADPHGYQQAPREDAGAHAALELAELLSDAVEDGTLAAADAQLIARSRIAGDRIGDLARHRGLQPRTLWDRRQRAERTLVSTRRAPRPAEAHLCRSEPCCTAPAGRCGRG